MLEILIAALLVGVTLLSFRVRHIRRGNRRRRAGARLAALCR